VIGIAAIVFAIGVAVGRQGANTVNGLPAHPTDQHQQPLESASRSESSQPSSAEMDNDPVSEWHKRHPVPRCDRSAGYYDPRFVVLAANLQWTRGPAPKELKRVLFDTFQLSEKANAARADDGDETFSYARVDLVGDDEPEWIVEYPPDGGSGGKSFVVLAKVNQQWTVVTGFLGGFVFKKTSHKFEDLVIYERQGDSYTRVVLRWADKQHRFREVSHTEIPQELHDLASGYIDMWNFFWFLAGDRPGCTESSAGQQKDYTDMVRPKRGVAMRGDVETETVPLRMHNDMLQSYMDALKAGMEHGVPQFTPQDVIAMFLREGRADWGFNR
jgi:hypothetical protein